MSNIVDVVAADRNLANTLKKFKITGLATPLSRKGLFTFFSPIEKIFGELVSGKIEHLAKDDDTEMQKPAGTVNEVK